MKETVRQLFLVLIFAFALGIRLYFAASSGGYSPEAYFDIRQIESIRETGLPIMNDELSYGGREFLFLPAFHYLLAFFNMFMGIDLVLLIFPNLFSAAIVFAVYLFTRKLTNSDFISLFTALASAFVPIHFMSGLNSVSPLSLQITLIFFALYCFSAVSQKKYLIGFTLLTFALPLVHGSSVILIMAFVVFLAMSRTMGFQIERKNTELIIFYVFISLWITLIVFKKAFLMHGVSIIWQNIPFMIRNTFFVKTTIFETMLTIGLLPVISGAFACYVYMLKTKENAFYLLVSLAISLLALVWSRLITPILGLSLLGITLVILSGTLLSYFTEFIEKTKFAKLKHVFVALFVFVFILNLMSLTLVFASNPSKISENDLHALNFLAKLDKGTVIAPMELGHAIAEISGQKTVADSTFFLVTDVEQRLNDINTVYSTPFEINAISIMNKYDVTYLYVPAGKQVKYIEDRCFSSVYDGPVKIYKMNCTLQEEKK
jgi:hypothetical protein